MTGAKTSGGSVATDEWKKASLQWIENKRNADGVGTCELIYELDEEPDSFRQIEVLKDDLYPEIRRGDSILVNLSDKKIRRSP